MPLSNTHATYGSVAKCLHWLTMLLIFTALPLGMIANDMAYQTADALAQKAWLFSLHKTVGVSVFFVALARIAWTLFQPTPAPLHPDRQAETFLASVVHWALYLSLVIVPLSGWIHHAATSGFAPILWPFGDALPLVPKSETVAHVFGGIHGAVTKVLVGAIVLHVAGALKHHLIDRDATLRRMLPGTPPLPALPAHSPQTHARNLAVALYLAVVALGAGLGLMAPNPSPTAAKLAQAPSDWTVQDGTLSIAVQQLGSTVTGSFADWTAAITFDPAAVNGTTGNVQVTIAIASLKLGSVTDQAIGADFFDAGQFPTATFTALILATETGYVADGTLTLKDRTVPVTLPFALTLNGDTATMAGTTTLNRTAFGIGESYPDGSTVGLTVDVAIALTATRP